jgi:RNA polymerase sigma factor (sigma-70 family)
MRGDFRAYCRRCRIQPADTDDIISKVTLALLARGISVPVGSEPGRIRALVFVIFLYRVADYFREKGRRTGETLDQTNEPVAHTPDPADPLIEEEHRRFCTLLLAQLTEPERQVVQLWLKGCTFEEIGQRIGKSAAAARQLKCRAVRRLRGARG